MHSNYQTYQSAAVDACLGMQLQKKLPTSTVVRCGRIVKAVGTSLRATGLVARVGQRVVIQSNSDSDEIFADVVGIENDQLILYPLGSISGVAMQASVKLLSYGHQLRFSNQMLGRVFDGLGNVLDGGSQFNHEKLLPLNAEAPSPMDRLPIKNTFCTGVKAIDSFLTLGEGQRMGIFATAGAGKSTLLTMLARSAAADVIVIALIGERGREVREFVQDNLDESTRKRTVVYVSTSDRPAMERVLAAHSATAAAEGFRTQGKKVVLLMDSVTRYARALREIGLSVGEPPVRRGFPPSVFASLPGLFERAGNDDKGSITAFYTVLMEGEDGLDPIAEETRSILDGHIILTRKLGEAGHYPAIDVLASSSRLFLSLVSDKQRQAALHIRKLMAKYLEIEFLIQVGEYVPGADLVADEAIKKHAAIQEFLAQSHLETEELPVSIEKLEALAHE